MAYQTSRIFLIAAAFGLSAGAAQAGPLITGNQSINSSLCVGSECVASEAYGFDTIRLKDNNLRIHFDDSSSSSGSFPSNDWRIVVNESASGGANYLAIEDDTANRIPFTIEAGTRSNQLYLADSNRVGFGTNTPSADLHVKQGNTPTLRLDQDGSSGFAAQTWDVAGNEFGFFIRDATNGNSLPLRIFSGAASNSLVISDNGRIGLGAGTTPDALLHVQGGGGEFAANASTMALFQNSAAPTDVTRFTLLSGNAGNGQIAFGDTDSEFAGRIRYFHTDNHMDFLVNGTVEALRVYDGSGPNALTTATSSAVLTSAGVWQDASSRTLKQNIRAMDLTDAKSALRELEPVTYQYKKEPGELVAGFVAEDVPDMVATSSRKTLSALDITAVLTKVVQDQQDTIENMQIAHARQIAALTARIDALEQ